MDPSSNIWLGFVRDLIKAGGERAGIAVGQHHHYVTLMRMAAEGPLNEQELGWALQHWPEHAEYIHAALKGRVQKEALRLAENKTDQFKLRAFIHSLE